MATVFARCPTCDRVFKFETERSEFIICHSCRSIRKRAEKGGAQWIINDSIRMRFNTKYKRVYYGLEGDDTELSMYIVHLDVPTTSFIANVDGPYFECRKCKTLHKRDYVKEFGKDICFKCYSKGNKVGLTMWD